MSSYMADLSGLANSAAVVAKNSTSRKDNTELKMEDFLTLMVVQLQNQTIDDTADTSEMLNQMVQMQMVTALANMTDASLMTYASSLVGKEVTIGVPGEDGLEERVVTIIGTGIFNGQQVLFGDDNETYELSQIMAVGRLPKIEEGGTDDKTETDENPNDKVDGTDTDNKTDSEEKDDGTVEETPPTES